MNWMQEYDAEIEAKAKSEIEAERAEWNAMTPIQKEACINAERAKRAAEDQRQERIRQQHVEMFGEDEPCKSCAGSGVCDECCGTGADIDGEECEYCEGSGECPDCGGVGEQ